MESEIVLVVAEDDEDHYFLIQEAFQSVSPKVRIFRVKDGEELMDFLLQKGSYQNGQAPRPDLILLDLNMPKKDGREALKEIKSQPELKAIPVIVLTTSRDPQDVIRSYGLGANSFMRKPFGFAQWRILAKIFGQYWFEMAELPEVISHGDAQP